jgi:hypothetical protein
VHGGPRVSIIPSALRVDRLAVITPPVPFTEREIRRQDTYPPRKIVPKLLSRNSPKLRNSETPNLTFHQYRNAGPCGVPTPQRDGKRTLLYDRGRHLDSHRSAFAGQERDVVIRIVGRQ